MFTGSYALGAALVCLAACGHGEASGSPVRAAGIGPTADARAAEPSDAAFATTEEESEAQAPPALEEERYCAILERGADQAALDARAILSKPDSTLHEARVLSVTNNTMRYEHNPRVAALLRGEGISDQARQQFFEKNGAGVLRCQQRYDARLASYADVFARLEAFAFPRPGFVTSAPRICVSEERLRRPVLAYGTVQGFCGSTFYVDGAGGLWSESGCEHGASPTCRFGKLTAKGFALYRAALDRLRAVPHHGADWGKPDCSNGTPEVILSTAGVEERRLSLSESSGVRRWPLCPGMELPRVFQDVLDVLEH